MPFSIPIWNCRLLWVFVVQLHVESQHFWRGPLAHQAAGLYKWIFFSFHHFSILHIRAPNQRGVLSFLRCACQEWQRLLAANSHSRCATLPAAWGSCGTCAFHNCICRVNVHLQIKQHLNAIALPLWRSTKYQEDSLYIILAVKCNFQCSWHQDQRLANAQTIPLSGRLQSLGGKHILIYSGSQKPRIKWKRQKYLPT